MASPRLSPEYVASVAAEAPPTRHEAFVEAWLALGVSPAEQRRFQARCRFLAREFVSGTKSLAEVNAEARESL